MARPYVDEIVFRPFANPDAMVTALQRGEIDAAHNIPAGSVPVLEEESDIVVVQGQQGGFDELALNAGGGPVPGGHPALEDLVVRQAINYAIDKEAIVDRVYDGLAEPATTMSPSPDPKWIPDIPVEDQYTFDPDRANEILDEAGYEDTDDDGVREMPDGGEPLNFRYAVRSESEIAQPVGRAGHRLAVRRRHRHDHRAVQRHPAHAVHRPGRVGHVRVGLDALRRPRPAAVVLPVRDDRAGRRGPDQLLQRRQLVLARSTTSSTSSRTRSWTDERRVELVHEMLTLFYEDAAYVVLDYAPDLQAYRTDRFEGWVRQPAETGPVIFSNTSPSYVQLAPVSGGADGDGGGDDGGSSTGLIIALAAIGVLVVGGGAFALGRRGTADERE